MRALIELILALYLIVGGSKWAIEEAYRFVATELAMKIAKGPRPLGPYTRRLTGMTSEPKNGSLAKQTSANRQD